MTMKLRDFFASHAVSTPCLVIDLDIVESNYRMLCQSFAGCSIYYAVKANPAPEIIGRLRALGSCFDAASLPEIELCLRLGVCPSKISWGNTIKRESDIARAYERGIRLFAFDCEEELAKLSRVASGARVYCRVHMGTGESACPVSAKFGCLEERAEYLLHMAHERGLEPYGVSFHLGSQQTSMEHWDDAIGCCASLFRRLESKGIGLRLLNLGGGFPVRYGCAVPSYSAYGGHVRACVAHHFGNRLPTMCIEPGRAMVATSGVIKTEVLLVALRDDIGNGAPWVYVDSGRSGGLVETVSKDIIYPLLSATEEASETSETMEAILAGPTCDWSDILNEGIVRAVPKHLRSGDHLFFGNTGAYTSTCCSVGFNGFPPLTSYYI
ncbi:MAG: type III PLP-dependent enzyme [Alphaproteobacteria bacterium GM7ARS4]|nr:type III PLP-dependent enzyme [Alphaproteobacteria bacterium GM7ARS4]